MARFAGLVCYGIQAETSPGVWTNEEKTRVMKGDIIRQNADIRNSDQVNSEISLGHRLSLIGDPYAFENYYNILWVMISGQKWRVTSVEIQRPRLILSIGGVYNG